MFASRSILSRFLLCLSLSVGVISSDAPNLYGQYSSASSDSRLKWGIGLGGGATIPLGAYSTTDKLGWNALLVFDYTPFQHFSFRLDGTYMETARKSGGPTERAAVLGGVLWYPSSFRGSVRPYILAGAGGSQDSRDTSSRFDFAYDAGVGTAYRENECAGLFAEARYISTDWGGRRLNGVVLSAGFAFDFLFWIPDHGEC